MTLQYRRRSRYEDQQWQARIRLSHRLLLETIDWWCRSDFEFPFERVATAILYLFSPRCFPSTVREYEVRQQLHRIVDTPVAEYSLTWPQRSEGEAIELIRALTAILKDAVQRWTDGSLDEPSAESVNQQIVDQIVARRYVVFHHKQTTRRDFGGFHGNG